MGEGRRFAVNGNFVQGQSACPCLIKWLRPGFWPGGVDVQKKLLQCCKANSLTKWEDLSHLSCLVATETRMPEMVSLRDEIRDVQGNKACSLFIDKSQI